MYAVYYIHYPLTFTIHGDATFRLGVISQLVYEMTWHVYCPYVCVLRFIVHMDVYLG
jgi:hypothetical protein